MIRKWFSNARECCASYRLFNLALIAFLVLLNTGLTIAAPAGSTRVTAPQAIFITTDTIWDTNQVLDQAEVIVVALALYRAYEAFQQNYTIYVEGC